MNDEVLVVVFPSVFAKNKTKFLVSNIKKILKIRNQGFQEITIDDGIIVVKADDPVFASSAINILFGIKQVAIANKVENKFDTIVSQINKVGSNLLLRGERFIVKVEGSATGYVPKDLEISATGKIIESTVDLDVKPGTENRFDKLLYTFLTRSNAYTCIFSDTGLGGIPNNSQNVHVLCCIYDELSAVSVVETIKEGFTVKLLVCYRNEQELRNIIKILNLILPQTVQTKIELEFLQLDSKLNDYSLLVNVITDISISICKSQKISHLSLPITPLIFPAEFTDNLLCKTFQNSIIPLTPLVGMDEDIFQSARRLGMGKFLTKIEKLNNVKFPKDIKAETRKITLDALKSRQKISVKIGSNNIHDILDSLGLEH